MLALGRTLGRHVVAVSDRARSHVTFAHQLLDSVDAFSDRAAGVGGTTNALAQTARRTGCDIYRWDIDARIITDVRTGAQHLVAPAMAQRLDNLLTRRQPIRIPDVIVDGHLPASVSTAGGTRAAVLAPMMAGDHQLGFVMRRYGCADAMYEQDERDRVVAVASIGSVALGKALVVDSERRRARDNAMLLRSIEHASSADLTEVIGVLRRRDGPGGRGINMRRLWRTRARCAAAGVARHHQQRCAGPARCHHVAHGPRDLSLDAPTVNADGSG